MSDRCFDFEELDAMLRSEAGDLRWAHLEECPRCRSRLALYRSYVAVGNAPDDPAEQEVSEKLREILEGAILGPAPGEATRTRGAGPPSRIIRLLAEALQPRRLAPVLGTVALVAAAVLFVRTWQPWTGDESVLRGGGDETMSREVVVSPPRVLDTGGLQLRWQSVPGAQTYRVRLLSSGYEDLARFDAGRDTVLSLSSEQILQPAGRPVVSFWLVEALDHGDPVAESAPSIIPPRGP